VHAAQARSGRPRQKTINELTSNSSAEGIAAQCVASATPTQTTPFTPTTPQTTTT